RDGLVPVAASGFLLVGRFSKPSVWPDGLENRPTTSTSLESALADVPACRPSRKRQRRTNTVADASGSERSSRSLALSAYPGYKHGGRWTTKLRRSNHDRQAVVQCGLPGGCPGRAGAGRRRAQRRQEGQGGG